jgi:hypothetical protein
MQLTQAQLQTLKTAINTNTDPTFVGYRNSGNAGAMAGWYNVASTFVVWKWSVTIVETGEAFNGTEWAGKTSADIERLTSVATYLSQYNASDDDIRTMFNDIWSGAGGQITRANLLALWKRFALKGEQLYCTGTGTDAVPGKLNATAQGDITTQNILDAQALP